MVYVGLGKAENPFLSLLPLKNSMQRLNLPLAPFMPSTPPLMPFLLNADIICKSDIVYSEWGART